MTMVTTMVEVAVDHTNFIARSRASMEALKSANLLKSLNINALIMGEHGVGKTTLASYILGAPVVSGENLSELLSAIENNSRLIIKNFDKISNFQSVKEAIKKNKTRIIATAPTSISESIADEFFSLRVTLPPLRERPEDVEPLMEKFFEEVRHIFNMSHETSPSLKDLPVDLSKNGYSIRRSIYTAFLMKSFNESEILQIMETYLAKHLGSGNDYRDLQYLFDVPLLRAGFKAFGSQLSMAEKFGLNRNTLRKKVNDLKDYLE